MGAPGAGSADIALRPWSDDDLAVLERSNTPEMTAFLGGPETQDQLVRRHDKFLRLGRTGEARMFVIVSDGAAVGSIGYWTVDLSGVGQYEIGWSIHSAHQGRGFASAALRLCIDHAADQGDRQFLIAFPRIDNTASNALCRRVGFRFVDERDFEYPKGHPIRVNAWEYDLSAATG